MRLCSGKQCFIVSLQAIARHKYKVGLGCLLLPVHWCFAGGRWTWKPTPKVLYFREEVDGARICLVCKGPTTSSFYR